MYMCLVYFENFVSLAYTQGPPSQAYPGHYDFLRNQRLKSGVVLKVYRGGNGAVPPRPVQEGVAPLNLFLYTPLAVLAGN